MSESSNMLGGAATSVTSTSSENSSKNILDILNDDCIGDIFRRLKHLEDLVNAANTCKRFRECAMSLKSMFRSVAIENIHLYSGRDVVSAHNAPQLLRNFGQLIESVEWRLVGNHKRDDRIFNLLAKFCGETLKMLRITNYNPNFKKRKQFPALERLVLYNAEPKNFFLDSPLKYLEIGNFREIEDFVNLQPWFVREFPHLESICFNSTEITDYTLNEFLSFNPQLRALEVDSEYLTPMIFRSIGFYSRNIERLLIKSVEFHEYESSDFHEELLHLSALRKLSEFGITGRLSLKILLEMFAENIAPIQSLEVDMEPTDKMTTYPTIKTLNKLQCIFGSNIDENCLINLVKSQPALQILQVVNMGSDVTIEAIEKILKFGKSLTDFELTYCSSNFDLESYNRILSLAINRVKVRVILSKRGQLNVPTDIFEINRNWLDITFD